MGFPKLPVTERKSSTTTATWAKSKSRQPPSKRKLPIKPKSSNLKRARKLLRLKERRKLPAKLPKRAPATVQSKKKRMRKTKMRPKPLKTIRKLKMQKIRPGRDSKRKTNERTY